MPVAPPIMPYPGMIGGYGFNSWGGVKNWYFFGAEINFCAAPPPKMHFKARLTRRQFFRPLFLCKSRFLESKIMKNMFFFSKIMVLRETTASTQKRTQSCCFLSKKEIDFFFRISLTRRHPQLRSEKYVFVAKVIQNH